MQVIQTLKKHYIITIIVIVFIIAIIYFLLKNKTAGTSSDLSVADQIASLAPAAVSGPSIDYSVRDINRRSINYTLKAGGNTISGTAILTTALTNISFGDRKYFYSVQGNGIDKIVLSIQHIETSPTVHYVEDKSVTVQF